MQVRLNIIGVGYKANIVKHAKSGTSGTVSTYLQLNVGHSHPYFIPIPGLLDISIIETAGATAGSAILINPKQELLKVVQSTSAMQTVNALLTNFAATLARIPKKDVYKGKGLRYDNEIIKLKVVNKK